MTTTDTTQYAERAEAVDTAGLEAMLAEINGRLARMEECVDDVSRRLESFDDLKEDLIPMTHSAIQMANQRMHELELNGTLDFVKESGRVAETIATSFTPEDVRLLGENVVSILNTVRNLTQPEMLGVADRAATALQAEPDGRVGLLKAMRDPEIRKGMALLFGVLRELGQVSTAKQLAAEQS